MNLADTVGEICRIVLPIPDEVFYGNRNSQIAVCTLSSMPLLRELSGSRIMSDVAIAGRLLSENRGIDSLITGVLRNPKIATIILCGREVRGHRAGHSLLALHKNGISREGRIIGSLSPDPALAVPARDVESFRRQVSIVDKIGEARPGEITRLVDAVA